MTTHRPLYVGFLVALAVCAVLAKVAFRRLPGFPVDAPLVTAASPHLDEWPATGK